MQPQRLPCGDTAVAGKLGFDRIGLLHLAKAFGKTMLRAWMIASGRCLCASGVFLSSGLCIVRSLIFCTLRFQ